ncbi:hypothetical protein ACHAW5_004760 [Stephanodiscus triporus]|uniref:PH domain-containing protein n=1 Tax=Stephanodiscus triporus TaxID=2934178 RepID=A0ABD3MQJ9_9STRA
MAQSLFKQKRRHWDARSSLVELNAQDSSADCTINLDGIQLIDSTSSRQDRSESKAMHSGSSISTLTSSISSSSFRTAEDTESLSNSSRIGGVGCRSGRTLSDMIYGCLVCCWPAVQSEKPHNDCFVTIDCSSPHAAYPNTIEFKTCTALNTTNNCFDRIQKQPVDNGNENEVEDPPKRTISPQLLNENAKDVSDILARLSPITVNSKASEQTKNGTTKTSTDNSLHRRTNDTSNMGFFTPQILTAIHTSPIANVDGVFESSNQDGRRTFGASERSAFYTPKNSVRHDSDAFRRSIEVVTCEEKSPDGSDVSSIGSAFFSPVTETSAKRKNDEKQVTNGNLTPIQTPDSCQKKLMFDTRSEHEHTINDTPNVAISAQSIDRGWNLVQGSMPISMSRHLSPLAEVLKALQSIVMERPGGILKNTETKGCAPMKDSMPISMTTPTTALPVTSTSTSEKINRLWRDDFLQKSPSFPKALRRSGRFGKVIIQGWVAYRGNVTWKEIIRNPKRCDFRYVVLLDDKPLLHLFRSRSRRKRSTPKHDLLSDCKSLDLTGDISVRVNLVSKEMGNEVCIFDHETGIQQCGLLAIPMPQCAFLDGHRSRLAKGEALKGVFGPYKKVVTFAPSSSSSQKNEGPAAAHATANLPSPVEQNDVSRHLLFAIDVVIKFPPPRAPPPRAADVVVQYRGELRE